MKKNRYCIGETPKYHNSIYDWARVLEDMKKVLKKKIKFNKHLYEVFSMRFTIAHDDLRGWVYTYNENWGDLSRQITTYSQGDFIVTKEDEKNLIQLKLLLEKNYNTRI